MDLNLPCRSCGSRAAARPAPPGDGSTPALRCRARGAVFLLRDHADIVHDAVWNRAVIVVGSAALTDAFAEGAAGRLAPSLPPAARRHGGDDVAIAVIAALPGLFLLWLRIEQGVCGLLLLSVVRVARGLCQAARASVRLG
ncbi:hypothetical protein [Streptomyces collinus]|uniref:hypothetical protein n=1 Tax=Streptomyces collinus TaxID=42684 RepID=UPI00332AF0BC